MLTLRYIKDNHLNPTMGYLTACAFYAALFNRNPEGLPIDTVNDRSTKDGNPLKTTFSATGHADLQRIVWEGLQLFRQAAASGAQR